MSDLFADTGEMDGEETLSGVGSQGNPSQTGVAQAVEPSQSEEVEARPKRAKRQSRAKAEPSVPSPQKEATGEPAGSAKPSRKKKGTLPYNELTRAHSLLKKDHTKLQEEFEALQRQTQALRFALASAQDKLQVEQASLTPTGAVDKRQVHVVPISDDYPNEVAVDQPNPINLLMDYLNAIITEQGVFSEQEVNEASDLAILLYSLKRNGRAMVNLTPEGTELMFTKKWKDNEKSFKVVILANGIERTIIVREKGRDQTIDLG